MNRRDVIIVAVFINVGLLVTLFVSSLKKEPGGELAKATEKEQQIESALSSPPKKSGGDQIDQVISHYTAKVKTEEKKEEVLPAPVLTFAPKAEVESASLRSYACCCC